MRHFSVLTLLAVTACSTPERAPADAPPSAAEVTLPPELDRVLRDYERASARRDGGGLAELFTADGMLLPPGGEPVTRPALERALAGRAGSLRLFPIGYGMADSVAYIIGMFGSEAAPTAGGKFMLALRRSDTGRWLIAADIDNANRW